MSPNRQLQELKVRRFFQLINRLEDELKSFTKPESPADVFSLRYGDFLSVDGDDRGWEVWTKVVARRDIEERLMRPWNGRGGAL